VTSDAEFFCSLAQRLQKLYAGSTKNRDKGFLGANFKYGDNPREPDMQWLPVLRRGLPLRCGELQPRHRARVEVHLLQ
jgi:hypothetical protein